LGRGRKNFLWFLRLPEKAFLHFVSREGKTVAVETGKGLGCGLCYEHRREAGSGFY
jgi:hypothetical protein